MLTFVWTRWGTGCSSCSQLTVEVIGERRHVAEALERTVHEASVSQVVEAAQAGGHAEGVTVS